MLIPTYYNQLSTDNPRSSTFPSFMAFQRLVRIAGLLWADHRIKCHSLPPGQLGVNTLDKRYQHEWIAIWSETGQMTPYNDPIMVMEFKRVGTYWNIPWANHQIILLFFRKIWYSKWHIANSILWGLVTVLTILCKSSVMRIYYNIAHTYVKYVAYKYVYVNT